MLNHLSVIFIFLLSLNVFISPAESHASSLAIKNITGNPFVLKPDHDAHELSGITYTGGDKYYAVGDNTSSRFYELEIKLHPDGSIKSAKVVRSIPASLSYDSEDIIFYPPNGHLFICSESDHSVKKFSTSGGKPVKTIKTIPGIYKKTRINLSLESISYGNKAFWICNEEALPVDGDTAYQLKKKNETKGTIVRLQKFDETFTPVSQYAYEVDPVSELFPENHGIFKRLAGKEVSGVSALAVLPAGQLLVLERSLGYHGITPFRNRIYLVDFEQATDVSKTPSLKNAEFKTVKKTKLWESFFLIANYEGMCLGPKLNDGSYVLVLISDDGGENGANTQKLRTLKLKGLP